MDNYLAQECRGNAMEFISLGNCFWLADIFFLWFKIKKNKK